MVTKVQKRPPWLWVLACILCSCGHDLSVPLENDPPRIRSVSSRVDTMVVVYPETTVCTLNVEDYNDDLVSLDTTTWFGGYTLIDTLFGPKQLVLFWPPEHLGTGYSGVIRISDPAGSMDSMSYCLSRHFLDNFDAVPPASHWIVSQPDDSTGYLRMREVPAGMEFFFPKAIPSSTEASISLISRFRLRGDFEWKLDYVLRERMADGYNLALYCSTVDDTGFYEGDRAGVVIAGVEGGGMVIRYFDATGAGQLRADDHYWYGPIRFRRQANAITVEHKPASQDYRTISGRPLNSPMSDSLYVHIRMSVTSQVQDRSCTLFDFVIRNGEILPE